MHCTTTTIFAHHPPSTIGTTIVIAAQKFPAKPALQRDAISAMEDTATTDEVAAGSVFA
ncbi:MAG: hypothetical protein WC244_01630 [Patescibacteria group bacterium]|jgi:hypothetical protein